MAYLSDVALRSARKGEKYLLLGVVRLVNDNNVLVVDRTGDDSICASVLQVLMDFGA